MDRQEVNRAWEQGEGKVRPDILITGSMTAAEPRTGDRRKNKLETGQDTELPFLGTLRS